MKAINELIVAIRELTEVINKQSRKPNENTQESPAIKTMNTEGLISSKKTTD